MGQKGASCVLLPAIMRFLCNEPFLLGASSEAQRSNRYSCGSSSAPRLLPTVSPLNTTCHRLAEHWVRLSSSGCPCAIGREAGPARRFRLARPDTRSFSRGLLNDVYLPFPAGWPTVYYKDEPSGIVIAASQSLQPHGKGNSSIPFRSRASLVVANHLNMKRRERTLLI